jgi:hypothetical protein
MSAVLVCGIEEQHGSGSARPLAVHDSVKSPLTQRSSHSANGDLSRHGSWDL